MPRALLMSTLRNAWPPLFAALALCWLAAPAAAADAANLAELRARMAHAALPWCGRLVTTLADGARICDLRLQQVGGVQAPFALTHFDGVLLSSGLTDALSTPALALVIAHELSHIVQGHMAVRLRAALAALPPQQRFAGSALGGLLPQAPHDEVPEIALVQEFEADALGLVFVALAGYPLQAAVTLFVQAPLLGQLATATHPATADRRAAFQQRRIALCQHLARRPASLPLPAHLQPVAHYQQALLAERLATLDVARVCASPDAP